MPGNHTAMSEMGFWSATLAACFSLAYVIAQLAEWLGWLGSAGGAESSSTPLGLVLLLTPSLLLAPAFLLVIICAQQGAAPDKQVWGQAAVAFATVYTVLISLVYYVQLTLVAPRMAQGRIEGIEPFLFVPFDSFLYSADLLGYSFMSASMLLARPMFTGVGKEIRIRHLLLANGLLLPFLVLQIYWHALIWIASLWGIVFPIAMGLLAQWFYRSGYQEPTVAGS